MFTKYVCGTRMLVLTFSLLLSLAAGFDCYTTCLGSGELEDEEKILGKKFPNEKLFSKHIKCRREKENLICHRFMYSFILTAYLKQKFADDYLISRARTHMTTSRTQ